MKPETEMTVRAILGADKSVDAGCIDKVIDMLHNDGNSMMDMIHVVRFKDAMDILRVHRMTLQYYLNNGYLDRVYGCGKRALGVSRESLLKFINRRVIRTSSRREDAQYA